MSSDIVIAYVSFSAYAVAPDRSILTLHCRRVMGPTGSGKSNASDASFTYELPTEVPEVH